MQILANRYQREQNVERNEGWLERLVEASCYYSYDTGATIEKENFIKITPHVELYIENMLHKRRRRRRHCYFFYNHSFDKEHV